jgi:hypothetical protein
MRTALFFLAAAVLSSADEIVLKDGKRLVWKSIVDNGDSYTVENGLGQRLTIMKSDVSRLVVAEPIDGALTGATFTFDKKSKLEAIDLIAKLPAAMPGAVGQWKRIRDGLSASSANAPARLPLNCTPPEEYDLTVVAERKDGADDLFVGLVAGGRQFTAHFDSGGGSCSGILRIDGKSIPENESSIAGQQFKAGKPRTAVFMVRKAGIVVQLDGKDVVKWKGDWNRLSMDGPLMVVQKNTLLIGVYLSSWTVSRIVLTYPREK